MTYPTTYDAMEHAIDVRLDEVVDDARICEAWIDVAYSEDASEDHFYGAWSGGSKSEGGGPVSGASSRAMDKHADALYAQAVKDEPAITEDMKSMATAAGGTMEGLEFRLKTKESLRRKIGADVQALHITPKAAAAGINDHLRYTMKVEPGNYASAYGKAADYLASKGYTPIGGKIPKDFWRTPGSSDNRSPVYQGVNAVFQNRSGARFELQFHTQQSWDTKMANHPIYERFRTSTSAKERRTLWAEMQHNQTRVVSPTGWPPSGHQFRAGRVPPDFDVMGAQGG